MAMTPEERLQHDVVNGIRRMISALMPERDIDAALSLDKHSDELADRILNELRIRWTIIERPRKQRTLRQES